MMAETKKYIRFKLCLLVVFGLILIFAGSSPGNQSEELFPLRKYGNLEPDKTYPKDEFTSKYQNLFFERHDLIKESRMLYSSLPPAGMSIEDETVIVFIYSYDSIICAENKLRIQLYAIKELLNDVTFNGYTVIFKPVKDVWEKYDRYYWVSGEKLINIYSHSTETPDELIADLLELHPPTIRVDASRLDPQDLIKFEIESSHEMIKDAEPMRTFPSRVVNRPDAYIGMVAQCISEFMIRCWSGMCSEEENEKYVDCPITLMDEDISRYIAWKGFRGKTMSQPIVEENVNWTSIPEGGIDCRFRHKVKSGEDSNIEIGPRALVLDALNMSPKELKPLLLKKEGLPDGIIP